MASIDINDLASTIVQSVKDYSESVSKAIAKEVDKTSKEMLAEIKAKAPKDTGEYASGFKITKNNFSGSVRRTIWNVKEPSLGHLLENGHAKVGGGRVDGKPHIRPAYDKYSKLLIVRIENIIRDGGSNETN